ncbi:MAG: peptidoglycan DD-metalloendopeptidase family protein [Deltaproteobacteria bacterium]|nr:peptidoglycan DD-metalloendopeptidase family protein [Deltaproteobacteria bacterium]
MAVLPFQLALVAAALVGPAPWLPEAGTDCGVGHAPGNVISHRVVEGDRLAAVMRDAGLPAEETARLARAMRPYLKLSNLSIGDRIDLARTEDGRLLWFRHRHDLMDAVCARRTLRDQLVATRGPLEAKTALARVQVQQDGTLSEALVAAGEDPRLAVMVQEIMPSTAEAGKAQVTLVVERRAVEGELLDYGRVFAVERKVDDAVERAFHYVGRGGGSGYYDETGAPMRSTRLRSPVSGAHMTSGYGVRKHPIKRRRRMHKGIDFGADRGTPVLAAADGVVTTAAWKGQLGRMVALAHEGGLTTHYGHLSAFALNMRPGRKVRQGQTIGYVGSTGLSSGAHLHFETLVKGRHMDPAQLLAAPAPALPEAEEAAYQEHVRELLALLYPAPPPQDA